MIDSSISENVNVGNQRQDEISADANLHIDSIRNTNAVVEVALSDGPKSEATTNDNRDKKRKNSQINNNRNLEKSLKKRHNESRPNKENRICSFISKGQECPFAPNCQYNHDPLSYLATKPTDLGETCYQFETFGYCPNGLMCRYGTKHINFETGENVKRPIELGGVIERIPINILRKEIQIILRKKKYGEMIKQQKEINSEANTKLLPSIINSDASEATCTLTSQLNNIDASNVGSILIVDEKVDHIVTDQIIDKSLPSIHPRLDSKPIGSISFNDKNYVKLVDFSNKVYVAPLTTVGNLPFRRILKEFGADITCGEMAMANNIIDGQASEWALLRRHQSEDIFGIQVAGNQADILSRSAQILEHETRSDFVDLNCGCPIDVVCNKGCGASLLTKPNKLCDIVNSMSKQLSRSITVKVRTGWDDKNPTTHKLIPMLQKSGKGKIAAIMIHGRSRLQRYSKLANWEYILQAAQSQDPTLPRIPIIGNGDILSWEDWNNHQNKLEINLRDSDSEMLGLCSCAMLARGALIRPWLPTEIKEKRHIDMSASDRLDMLKRFCNYGLEHWGSDQQGLDTTRRFLLEWLSFLHRYVPVGLLENGQSQKMNQSKPIYLGRSDLETLLGSSDCNNWIKISELLLGPTPDNFHFIPKHKANNNSNNGENVIEPDSNG
eukprot:gene4230-6006_t